MTDLPHDVVISADDVLFLATVGEVVFPSCSRGWAADGEVLFPSCSRGWTADVAVPAVVTAEIAAGAAGAGATAMRATVVASPWVAGTAARSVSAADVLAADCDHDRCRGARLSACLAGLAHGLHLQSRFSPRPHEQRLTRGTGRSFSFVPTETSPREPAHFPGLSIQSHLSLHTDKSRSGNVRAVQYNALDL